MTRTADKKEIKAKELKTLTQSEKHMMIGKNWNIPVTGSFFEEESLISTLIAI